MTTAQPLDIFKAALLAVCARKGVATIENLRHDIRGVADKDLWLAIYRLELAGILTHTGLSKDCLNINRAFRKYPDTVTVPKAKDVAFVMTVAGMKAALKNLGDKK